MNKQQLSFSKSLLVAALATASMVACTTTQLPTDKNDKAAAAQQKQEKERSALNSQASAALQRLYQNAGGSKELVAQAKGVLVFPDVLNAGLMVGGQYGKGVLLVGNQPAAYYSTVAVSLGLQAGAQSKAQFLLFMTDDALKRFRNSHGWTAGADASVVLLKVGANGRVDTESMKQPVIGFVLSNAGLMAGVSLDGQKISRIDM